MSRSLYGVVFLVVMVVGIGLGWFLNGSPPASRGQANAATPAVPAFATAAASLPEPLTQASEGKLQCWDPNIAEKTCQTLAAFKPLPNGSIANPSLELIQGHPMVTMRISQIETVKSHHECSIVQESDVRAATFSVEGGPATHAEATTIRRFVRGKLMKFLGREICSDYVQAGDHLISRAYIDGVYQPKLDRAVIWVSPADGFQVLPH